MTNNEISNALSTLWGLQQKFQETMEETGGEYTPEAQEMDEQMDALKVLLEGDGIDELGRWLRSVEDEMERYQAEKALADRRIKSCKNTIAYIKLRVGQVLRLTGKEKAKGTYYTFAQSVSKKTGYDAEALDREFLELATEAARNAGLPSSVDVALVTTAGRLQEDENLASLVHVDTTETATFRKPAKPKEKKDE